MNEKTELNSSLQNNNSENIFDNKQFLWETSTGERVFRQDKSVIVELPSGRSTLTTSHLNGGYREDIQYVFNHQGVDGFEDCGSKLKAAGSISTYEANVAERIGLDPSKSTGQHTAANMNNVVIVTKTFRDLEVTAVTTGGIEVNGGRAGDPASYYQENGMYNMVLGTINTILIIGADLPSNSMVRAVVTATEAKTVAIQQLMGRSKYSEGIATGSGTDSIAIVANRNSSMHLTDAGKHSKLGELIGKCVIEAVQKALAKETGLTPQSQCDMLIRLERFGIDEKKYWEVSAAMDGENRKVQFINSLRCMAKNPALVAATASVLHIVDEISWGLVPEKAGKKAAFETMKGLPEVLMAKNFPPFDKILNEKESIITNWIRTTAWIAKNGMYGETE
ncbi:adenosylcobinamide amidohydrolase [Methanolobus vulcani]|uniref:Adenosylcobinamide amidohydrolase n=1 Tax=Methanolobus vulcani TaxID=38026 RepID=A0A7Z8KRE0_9EURY|nr:adenosylcobinamide amidohydrolase [Methanolobus vulcani]TQD29540.1 hypothetical protein FKV42_00045 [Methanolobus vulcani]